MDSRSVLAIIPARGGSKEVPRKNLRRVAGIPLIAYTIRTAQSCASLFHRVIVSTEDDEIAAAAVQLGAEVPFRRPASLSGDDVPMVPVLQHAVTEIETMDGTRFEWICLLQPTAPLRTPDDIMACLQLAEQGDCDSVISVCQVFATHPALMKRIEGGCLRPFCTEETEGTGRRELAPAAYMRNGAIYLTRRDILMEAGTIWGRSIRPYIMPPLRSINVDSELDLKVLDLVIREREAADAAAH